MQKLGQEGDKMWRLAGLFGALGIEMAIAVMLGTWAGQWLDTKLHCAPKASLLGFAIGVGAAILGLVRAVRAARKVMAQPH